jgi:hypothetical protein
MVAPEDPFERARRKQAAANRERTPTERFEALCALLDFADQTAPRDAAAVERRRQVLLVRTVEKEKWREQLRRLAASQRDEASTGI